MAAGAQTIGGTPMPSRISFLLSYNRQFFVSERVFGGSAIISHEKEGRPIARVAQVAVSGSGAGKGNLTSQHGTLGFV